MKPILLFALVFYTSISYAQPAIQWQKAHGSTSGTETFLRIQQTNDGGYIAIGYSTLGGEDVIGHHDMNPGGDVWIVKMNQAGAISWAKCYGGTGFEYGSWIEQTTDNGYVFTGETRSNDGDVSGNHGTTTSGDAWVVKLDDTGKIEWQKCLGGSLADRGDCIRQTADGGYIMAGYTYSSNGDVSGAKGATDAWVVKLTSTGTISWQKCLGGTMSDNATCIIQTADGNYLVSGTSSSSDGDLAGNNGSGDGWILKLNNTGGIVWSKSYGGSKHDLFYGIAELPSSAGFVITGSTQSSDGDITTNKGEGDAWVLKIDATGSKTWLKTFGGTKSEFGQQVVIGVNGSYIIAGVAISTDGDVNGVKGLADGWIFSLSTNGDMEWQKTLGGTKGDVTGVIAKTTDDGLIVAGSTASDDGDATGSGYHISAFSDSWVVKLGKYARINTIDAYKNKITVYPTVTNGTINIKLQDIGDAAKVQMTDLFGRVVPSTQRQQGDIITLTPGNIPPATYLLKIAVGNDVHTARVVYQP